MSNSLDFELTPCAETLVTILQRLRAPGGCPWDREQNSHSLRQSLREECAEVLDAIDREDAENLREELGDLLMNLVFQAVIAQEKGEFTWAEVCREINEKMIRRHEHVFGNATAADSAAVAVLWQTIKSKEKNHAVPSDTSALHGVPPTLSSLDYAGKIQKKAAKVGFDWEKSADILDKIEEECAELRQALASGNEEHVDEELGDLLFATVNLARFRKRDSAEDLLRSATEKFIRRFHDVEAFAARDQKELKTCSATELEAYWQEAKQSER